MKGNSNEEKEVGNHIFFSTVVGNRSLWQSSNTSDIRNWFNHRLWFDHSPHLFLKYCFHKSLTNLDFFLLGADIKCQIIGYQRPAFSSSFCTV